MEDDGINVNNSCSGSFFDEVDQDERPPIEGLVANVIIIEFDCPPSSPLPRKQIFPHNDFNEEDSWGITVEDNWVAAMEDSWMEAEDENWLKTVKETTFRISDDDSLLRKGKKQSFLKRIRREFDVPGFVNFQAFFLASRIITLI